MGQSIDANKEAVQASKQAKEGRASPHEQGRKQFKVPLEPVDPKNRSPNPMEIRQFMTKSRRKSIICLSLGLFIGLKLCDLLTEDLTREAMMKEQYESSYWELWGEPKHIRSVEVPSLLDPTKKRKTWMAPRQI